VHLLRNSWPKIVTIWPYQFFLPYSQMADLIL